MNRVRPRRLGLLAVVLAGLVAGCATPSGSPGASATAVPPGISLTPSARAYLDAVNHADLDALVNAFAPDGEVVDVNRHIRGPEAIREWAREEVIGGTLRVEAASAPRPDTQRLRVHWAPRGSSGWSADYTFTGRADKILIADLQYADSN